MVEHILHGRNHCHVFILIISNTNNKPRKWALFLPLIYISWGTETPTDLSKIT